MQEIRNKIKESKLDVIDIKALIIDKQIIIFDLKEYLYQGLVIKEKEFRQEIKSLDLTPYVNKNVAITCSVDAIIPHWSYMLVTEKIFQATPYIYYGNLEEVEKILLLEELNNLDIKKFENKKVMLKGCGDIKYSELAYSTMTKRLLPIVKSLMYGEPCSAVPIYKQKKQ